MELIKTFFREFMNDAKAINSYVISLVIINPSLEKMACFYRTIYWFNHDEVSSFVWEYIFSLWKFIARVEVTNEIFEYKEPQNLHKFE